MVRKLINISDIDLEEEHWAIVERLNTKSRRPGIYIRHIREEYMLCELRYAGHRSDGKRVYAVNRITYQPLKNYLADHGDVHTRHEIREIVRSVVLPEPMQFYITVKRVSGSFNKIKHMMPEIFRGIKTTISSASSLDRDMKAGEKDD